jgi:signal transduction histidine kinase
MKARAIHKPERYAELLEVGQVITSEMNFDVLFPLVIEHTNSIMDTEASSVFLFDQRTDELYCLVSTDLKKSEIRVPATKGISGWVFQHQTHSVVNDTMGDPRFDASVDAKTGFHTRNMLCVPLVNRQKECIGTLQTLNKREGHFTSEDIEVMISLSNYVTVALENSRLYEELKAMNKAKDRAISHLSHELKTPLALISAALGALSQKLAAGTNVGVERNLGMADRNVARLLRLQQEIDNIMNQKADEYLTKVSRLIEDVFHFVEHQRNCVLDDALERVSRFVGSIYQTEPEAVETIGMVEFLHEICGGCRLAKGGRNVEIAEILDEKAEITACRSALAKVFDGILRNAVENTPDEGKIGVTGLIESGYFVVHVRDFGTGITDVNRKLIFTGFFHTQDTNHYATKTPYAFNAGGSGADLLRAKVFSERYGFEVNFESKRCVFIPEDTDECPGRISLCRFASDESVCRTSGTVFTVKIPMTGHTGERTLTTQPNLDRQTDR